MHSLYSLGVDGRLRVAINRRLREAFYSPKYSRLVIPRRGGGIFKRKIVVIIDSHYLATFTRLGNYRRLLMLRPD